jgi:hypothetical protein
VVAGEERKSDFKLHAKKEWHGLNPKLSEMEQFPCWCSAIVFCVRYSLMACYQVLEENMKCPRKIQLSQCIAPMRRRSKR